MDWSGDDIVGEDPIESRVAAHDTNHVEFNLNYSVKSSKQTSYTIESYFFIPRSLGINKHTYDHSQFYSDVQGYIRFKTPDIPTRALVEGDKSLLSAIRSLVRDLPTDQRNMELQNKLSYELRMFGAVMRSNLREDVRVLRDRCRRPDLGDVAVGDIRKACERVVDDVRFVIDAWRQVRSEFMDRFVPESIRETYLYVDEYLSLMAELKIAALLRYVDSSAGVATRIGPVRDKLKALILAERSHRREAKYRSVVEDDSKNEYFVFRQGMLKKFIQSVLWLEISKEKEGQGVTNAGAAIAAGVAMLFAVLATILQMRYYMINSAGFVVAAVITYMLKDRIKDLMKGFFTSRLTRFLADYSVKIRDPFTGSDVGRCREAFSYLAESDIPREVLERRRKGATESIEVLAKPENVIKYEKAVTLRGRELVDRLYLKDYEVNDIIRLSIWQYLVRADDPVRTLPVYVDERDAVKRRQFSKVYHLNIVMVFRSDKRKPVYKRVRIVFDKQGIRRVMDVD